MTVMNWANPPASSLIVLEIPDVAHDRLDLRVGERALEGRHGALLAVLDAMDDEIVTARRAGELRTFAGFSATVLVAPAAGGSEELLHLGVVARFLRCRDADAGATRSHQR